MLDIDSKSRYHNKKALEKLLAVLSAAGLSRSSLYRSSYSGGWHLYLFFDEAVNSADLRRQLLKLLTLNDFQPGKGQLEIFPHPGGQGSLGLGLRLPLQPGWAWLNSETVEVEHERQELNATKALELFVDALDAYANPYEAFRQLKEYVRELEAQRAAATVHGVGIGADNVVPMRRAGEASSGEFVDFVRGVFRRLPPGIIVDNWYKGRLYHLNGLTGVSQRAEAIECLGHYFFYGDPSRDLSAMGYGYEQEREWAIREFLKARHNGQSKEINGGRGDAFAQVERAAHWLPPDRKGTEPAKYRAQRPVAWVRENANRKTAARKRIAEALDGLKNLGRSFTTVQLQQAAGCSRRTLYDHADIWRKDYEDLAEGFFAICTDEYNGVEGAGCSETKPPSATDQKITPTGLLAARQIVHEISMRAERKERQTQKAALHLRETAERKWLERVTALTRQNRSELSVQQLKALLSVLLAYLAMAPTEELQTFVQGHIDKVRSHLLKAAEEPISIVRPP